MHEIEMHEASEEFARCYQAAGRYLQAQAQGVPLNWLKADLTPPFLEHLSFRVGNQLFFIRIKDVQGQLKTPGSFQGVLSIAKGCRGHACLMPMRHSANGWTPDNPGWGLEDARTGKLVDPAALVSDEDIEMTDWELHDFAVQIVRDYVTQKLNRQLMSSQGNPEVDPSLWFAGDNGPEWVVVRAVRYPENEAVVPKNIKDTAINCAHLSKTGHFASVSVASDKETFESPKPTAPLYRGHGMIVSFKGLQSLKGIL